MNITQIYAHIHIRTYKFARICVFVKPLRSVRRTQFFMLLLMERCRLLCVSNTIIFLCFILVLLFRLSFWIRLFANRWRAKKILKIISAVNTRFINLLKNFIGWLLLCIELILCRCGWTKNMRDAKNKRNNNWLYILFATISAPHALSLTFSAFTFGYIVIRIYVCACAFNTKL